MKKYGFIVVLFFFGAISNDQTNDSFSDGDFLINPVWYGTTPPFIVNTALQLQLNASAAGSSYLATDFATTLGSNEWQFYIRLSFAPSSGNYARMYVASDRADLTQPLNGYFLQFGEAGSNDAIELFRQQGSTLTSICRGTNGTLATSFGIRVKLKRETGGVWTVFCDPTGGSDFQPEGTGTDNTIISSLFTGFLCVYTVSNATKFYFDDVQAGSAAVDPLPPAPVSPKDVIVSEILYDPSPPVGLPNAEYIELFNRSKDPINLAGWQLSDASTTALFTSHILQPRAYTIVAAPASAAGFSSFGDVSPIASLPSLNNDSDQLTLTAVGGLVVDQVEYSSSWLNDDEKEAGGWSLELIDPDNTCATATNWTASEDERGGTPGHQNSVFASKPDLTGPELLLAVAITKDTLMLTFNERLNATAPTTDSFIVDPLLTVSQVAFTDASLTSLKLALGMSIEAGQLYSVVVRTIWDCSGNLIGDHDRLEFALPQQADSLDVFINEVLFNPAPSGVDFVELFNASAKYIDLKGWRIGNKDDTGIREAKTLSSSLIFPPHSFLAFTPDTEVLINNFLSGDLQRFYQTSLPSLPDDAGTVAIADSTGRILDYFGYASSYHSKMLKDDEGVSLERISILLPTNDPQNWRSATSQSGYGTPGALNSVFRPENALSTASVAILPEVIAPGSGSREFAEIQYNFDRPGNICTLRVLDSEGRITRTLAENELLASQGFYRWDGDRDDRTRARSGYYIVWMEVFDLEGSVHVFRRRVVVALR